MTRIMMATVSHVTSSSGLRKFRADRFLFNTVYIPQPRNMKFFSTWIWQLTRPVPTQLYYFSTWLWTASTVKHTYANHPERKNYSEAERIP